MFSLNITVECLLKKKVSDAFEKVPSMIWEDEYQKYRDVMDIYRNIKIERWKEASK